MSVPLPDLSQYEREVLLPKITSILSQHVGKDNAVSNSQVREELIGRGLRCTDEQFRGILEYIRKTHTLRGVCASRHGYFIAASLLELQLYETELSGRLQSQMDTLESIRDDIEFKKYQAQKARTPQQLEIRL